MAGTSPVVEEESMITNLACGLALAVKDETIDTMTIDYLITED